MREKSRVPTNFLTEIQEVIKQLLIVWWPIKRDLQYLFEWLIHKIIQHALPKIWCNAILSYIYSLSLSLCITSSYLRVWSVLLAWSFTYGKAELSILKLLLQKLQYAQPLLSFLINFLFVHFSILYYSKQEKFFLPQAAEQLPDNQSASSISGCWSCNAHDTPEVGSKNGHPFLWICFVGTMQIFSSMFDSVLSSIDISCSMKS